MAKKRINQKQGDPILRELVSIKKLLVALLYKMGAQQTEVATALEMDTADVSRMLPFRKIKPIIKN